MRKLWGVVACCAAITVMATPAAAAKVTQTTKEKAACVIGAITWNGKENADAQKIAVDTAPFPELARSKDKKLRNAIADLRMSPSNDSAARAFGRWCKAHFKMSAIQLGSFSVPQWHTPVPTDFTIAIDVLSKQCFGSAGCNITYKPSVTYNAALGLDPSKTYTVVYDIAGGDSPITANLTIQGTQITYHNGLTETPDDGAVLTATPTQVFGGA